MLLCNCTMQTVTGGDVTADMIVLDTEDGFGSSGPGGPGITPAVPTGNGKEEYGVPRPPKEESGSGLVKGRGKAIKIC